MRESTEIEGRVDREKEKERWGGKEGREGMRERWWRESGRREREIEIGRKKKA